MNRDEILAPLMSAIRRDRIVSALIASLFVLGAGLIGLGVWQRSTAGDVQIVQRNSRCNAGDLAACRVVAEHLRQACTPTILARLPVTVRARERQRCGVLRRSSATRSRRAATRRKARARRRTSTTSSSSSPRSPSPAPATRRPSSRPPARRIPSTSAGPGPAPAPSAPPAAGGSPAPSPSPAAPAKPQPLITIPDGLPCVSVSQLIGCT